MNGTTIAGVVVMFFGELLMSDYKSFGMTNPAVGILVGGVGFFLACFGYFSNTDDHSNGGSSQRVTDNSI